ncbi:helix-turn-helix domain-containing protein [Acinetobacter soli]|uniref:helix-turn-helix domain-containing protein n=1 Tax=Acinetobacter soli TaxID=487316 RepID=UPI0012505018|nr:helix-turn-helix domain-containing protein [Acinetobacter soli]
MLNIKAEKQEFLHHLRSLGVVAVTWDGHGTITGIQREAYCGIGYHEVEIMWKTWLVARQSGIVLMESDIDSAVSEPGTATRKILDHIENVLVQKALVYSKGNQSQAALKIGMSRTKLQRLVKRNHSKHSLENAA